MSKTSPIMYMGNARRLICCNGILATDHITTKATNILTIARQVFDHFLLGQSPESTSTKSAELTESVADHVHEHLQEMESEDEEIIFH